MAELKVTKRNIFIQPSNSTTIVETDKIIQVGAGILDDLPSPDSENAVKSKGIVEYVEEKTEDKVPFRLRTLNPLPTTAGFRSRSQAQLYVDKQEDDGSSSSAKISLQEIKNLNTKILNVDNKDSIDYALVDEGDYIMIKDEGQER